MWAEAARDIRRLASVTLLTEAVVIVLAVPVAVTVGGTSALTAGVVGGGLAVGCLVVTALLRFRAAYVAGSLVQLAAIATGVRVPVMFFLGAVFAGLWATAIWLPLHHTRRRVALPPSGGPSAGTDGGADPP